MGSRNVGGGGLGLVARAASLCGRDVPGVSPSSDPMSGFFRCARRRSRGADSGINAMGFKIGLSSGAPQVSDGG